MSSGEHPPSPYSRVESSILSAALRHVPQLGFTPDALAAGSRDAGYLDASAAAFTRGAFELVNYHLVTRRLALREEVQFAEASAASKADGKPLGVGAKVRALALHRLRANADVLHQWQEVSTGRGAGNDPADSLAGTCTYGHAVTRSRFAGGACPPGRRDLVPRWRFQRRLLVVYKEGKLVCRVLERRAVHDYGQVGGVRRDGEVLRPQAGRPARAWRSGKRCQAVGRVHGPELC